jgi:hypothetical protein
MNQANEASSIKKASFERSDDMKKLGARVAGMKQEG